MLGALAVVNQCEKSLIALIIIDDYMKMQEVNAATIKISTNLRKSFAAARKKAAKESQEKDEAEPFREAKETKDFW